MGFGRKQSKMNNATAGTLPAPRPIIQPGPTTIHNHSTPWPSIIAVAFACSLLLLPVLWWVLVFLFDKMGSRNPERESALLLVSVPVGLIAIRVVGWLIVSLLEQWKGYKLELLREITEQKRMELAFAQSQLSPGRMNEADYEFAKVVLAVMMTAYDWLDQNSYDKFPGRWRPWSMRSAIEAGNGIGVKLTQDRANAVSVWLHEKGVITSPDGGQIAKKFPDLESVRAMLDREFGKPIQVISPTLRDNRGYDVIKQAN